MVPYNPWKPAALVATASIVAGLVLIGIALGLGLGIGLNNGDRNLTLIATTTCNNKPIPISQQILYTFSFFFNSKQFVDYFDAVKYSDKQQFSIQSTSSTNT